MAASATEATRDLELLYRKLYILYKKKKVLTVFHI